MIIICVLGSDVALQVRLPLPCSRSDVSAEAVNRWWVGVVGLEENRACIIKQITVLYEYFLVTNPFLCSSVQVLKSCVGVSTFPWMCLF